MEREFPSSRHHKLARKRAAAEGAAETAGCRKEGTTHGIHGTSKHAGHGAPTRSFRWRNVDVSEPESLRKTHLTWAGAEYQEEPLRRRYLYL